MLGVEVGRVVRVREVLVHVLGVLLKAALEPVTGPLQRVLDLLRIITNTSSRDNGIWEFVVIRKAMRSGVHRTQGYDIGSL